MAVIAAACVLVAAAIALAAALLHDDGITGPQVETVPATMRADHVSALSAKLDRGALVDIVGEQDGYYLVEYRGERDASPLYASTSPDASADADDEADGNADAKEAEPQESIIQEGGNPALLSDHGTAQLYIAKDYVRPSDQSAPEQRTGYVQSPTSLYPTAMLTGTPLAELAQNTAVTVLDEFADCLFVELADKTRGYISAKAVGDAPVEEVVEEDPGWADDGGYGYYSSGYYGGGGGGSAGGWQGGNIDLGSDSSGADGGDIDLADPTAASYAASSMAVAASLSFAEQAYADEAPAEHATVLSDGVQSYLGWFNRDEVADIADTSCLTEEEVALIPEGKSVVVRDGQWGLIDSNLVKFEDDEDYEPWEGFTASGAGFFPTYTLQGATTVLELNQNVTVIDDLTTCYVVMLGEQLGYMAKADVSAAPFEEPEEEEVVDYGGDYGYYGGGYYDYGYSAGGPAVNAGNTGSSSDVIESTMGGWTDEKL